MCRVVDMDTATDLFRVESEIPMNNHRSALAWSPDGHRLATGFAQGKVCVYRVRSDRVDVRIRNTGTASAPANSRRRDVAAPLGRLLPEDALRVQVQIILPDREVMPAGIHMPDVRHVVPLEISVHALANTD